MQTFYADLLITNLGPERRNVRIIVDEKNILQEIISGERQPGDSYAPGVVVPAFVNAHCHLELSHLKGKIPEREGGMTGFIRQVLAQRFQASESQHLEAMKEADRLMFQEEGIVAVGDISNFSCSSGVKKESEIYYHTFVELLGLEEAKAEEIVTKGIALQNEFRGTKNRSSSLSPHAPYSMSDELYKEIFRVIHPDDPLTIHMQESEDELKFCKDKSGPLADLFNRAGLDTEDFYAFGDVRPLKHVLPLFPRGNRLQLVHNTYTTEEEIKAAEKRRSRLSWCICLSANLFITGMLPDVAALCRNDVHVTIGTDSLASNTKLSMLNELKLISKKFPEIPFPLLVRWATLNGAEFLGIENRFGRIKTGMSPGFLLLENVNPDQPVFHDQVSIKRLC